MGVVFEGAVIVLPGVLLLVCVLSDCDIEYDVGQRCWFCRFITCCGSARGENVSSSWLLSCVFCGSTENGSCVTLDSGFELFVEGGADVALICVCLLSVFLVGWGGRGRGWWCWWVLFFFWFWGLDLDYVRGERRDGGKCRRREVMMRAKADRRTVVAKERMLASFKGLSDAKIEVLWGEVRRMGTKFSLTRGVGLWAVTRAGKGLWKRTRFGGSR